MIINNISDNSIYDEFESAYKEYFESINIEGLPMDILKSYLLKFFVDGAQYVKTHTWNDDSYPACDGYYIVIYVSVAGDTICETCYFNKKLKRYISKSKQVIENVIAWCDTPSIK